MKIRIVTFVVVLFILLLMATPVLAAGSGVSETGLGRCTRLDHGPGNGAASHIWVPEAAWENLNGGESGLHFMTP